MTTDSKLVLAHKDLSARLAASQQAGRNSVILSDAFAREILGLLERMR